MDLAQAQNLSTLLKTCFYMGLYHGVQPSGANCQSMGPPWTAAPNLPLVPAWAYFHWLQVWPGACSHSDIIYSSQINIINYFLLLQYFLVFIYLISLHRIFPDIKRKTISDFFILLLPFYQEYLLYLFSFSPWG